MLSIDPTAEPDIRQNQGGSIHSEILRAFLRNPLQTGALSASSSRLSKTLSSMAEVNSASVVVELGSGTGSVTREIVLGTEAHTRIIGIELDPGLAKIAKSRCPSVEIVNADALQSRMILDQRGLGFCDSLVCSVPWANMTNHTQGLMLDAIDSILRPGGVFTTFAYLHGRALPSARQFHRKLQSRYALVKRSNVIWANLPPAFVYQSV